MTEEWQKEQADCIVHNAISCAFERVAKETPGTPGFYAASATRKVFDEEFQIGITDTNTELGDCVATFELIR